MPKRRAWRSRGRESSWMGGPKAVSVCLLAFVGVLAVFVLAGCGSREGPDTPSAPAESPPPVVAAPTAAEAPASAKPAPTTNDQSGGQVVAVGDDSASLDSGNTMADASPATGGDLAELRYRFDEKKFYEYSFNSQTELGKITQKLRGTCTYSVAATMRPPSSFAPVAREQKGTGTAFVVHADGYLLSCAHVVRGATKIEVDLGGKTYIGKVLATDKGRDLALLRIPARGLPTLPLGDSDAVRLGQEVRAVGFPLTDVLGKSIKVTRGSLAGVLEHKRFKLLQVDASINPGNSGGPLVNERGEVVGVNSAKLVGADISTVGFAVPSNQAKGMLEKKQVAFATNGAGQDLSGPELADRVTPAVALVRVTIDDAANDAEEIALTFFAFGHMDQRVEQRMPPMPGFPLDERGEIRVDSLGEIASSDAGAALRGPMGPVAHMIFDTLSADGEQTWETQSTTSVVRAEGGATSPGGHPGPFGYRRPGGYLTPPRPHYPGSRPPRMPGSFEDPTEEPRVTVYPAVERAEYQRTEGDNGLVVIKKHFEFKTLPKRGEPVYLHMVGDGETTFDPKEGVPKKMTFEGTATCNAENITLRVPIKWGFELTAIKDRAQIKAAAERARAARAKTRKPSDASTVTSPGTPEPDDNTKPEPDDNAKLDEYLRAVRSPEKTFSNCYVPLSKISRMKPIESRRDEVSEALEPFLTSLNSSLRGTALRAVRTWGTQKNVPSLMRLLEEPDTGERRPAMKALAQIGGKEAAEKIAARVPNSTDSLTAARALKEMGAVAEPAVIKLLEHDAHDVRSRACDILREIGGQKSLAAIEKMLETDTDRSSRSAGERAVRELKKRT